MACVSLPVTAWQVLNPSWNISKLITDVFTLFLNSTHFEESVSCAFSWMNDLITPTSVVAQTLYKLKSLDSSPQAGEGLLHPVGLETPPWRNCWPKSACLLTVPLLLMVCADPYVKVSLMCDGRRLKKRKTSTKRNTLNPVYNEAIVFDVPPENIDQIHLSIAVMDYDRWDAWKCFPLQTHCAQDRGRGQQLWILSWCPSAATKQRPERWRTRSQASKRS